MANVGSVTSVNLVVPDSKLLKLVTKLSTLASVSVVCSWIL